MGIRKVLIANRGEIALRLLRTLHDLNIEVVVAHSKADKNSMPVLLADETICIGKNSPKESYLNLPHLVSAAYVSGCDAVHPGIGFLSEDVRFANAIEELGIKFIGPRPKHLQMMGDKIAAKVAARELNLPTIPGTEEGVDNVDDALAAAREVGYPVIIKAASGGGGRGMKVAYDDKELVNNYKLCRIEADAAFGDDRVYLEKYLANPRHIEVQVLGDGKGKGWHFYERDCSIQRRHQKVIEEAPSPTLSDDERHYICELSAKAVAEMSYEGVGTFEYLYENGSFYFIEMNTRLQVEHPITEQITGVDLVKLQMMVAAGEDIELKQSDITITGHAIEARINAEHPFNFTPSPGKITRFHPPGGIGVRVDSHIFSDYAIPPFYDSLVAKVITYGPDRDIAITRMKRAMSELIVDGIDTNILLHNLIISHDEFKKGDYIIHWLEHLLASLDSKPS